MRGSLRNLSIQQLRTFLEVARAGTLTRAAGRLGYAQSSVTVQVRALERCVGAQLFHRHSQGVRLTAEGEAVVRYAERMFELIEQMAADLHPVGTVTGRVMLGGPAVLTSYYLGSVLRRGRAAHPDLNVSSRTMRPGEVGKAVRTGEIDVGFTLTDDPATPPGPADPLRWRVLCPVDYVPVVPARALASTDRRPLPTGHGVVLIDDPECLAQQAFQRRYRALFGASAPVLEVGSIAGLMDALQDEATVAVVPRVAVEAKLAEGVVRVDPRLPSIRMYARASWRDGLGAAPAVQAIVRLAHEVLADDVSAARAVTVA